MNPLLEKFAQANKKKIIKVYFDEWESDVYFKPLNLEEEIEIEKSSKNMGDTERLIKVVLPSRLCDEDGNKIINSASDLAAFLKFDSETLTKLYVKFAEVKTGKTLEEMKADFSATR